MNYPLLTVSIASAACFALWPLDVPDVDSMPIRNIPIGTWAHRWGVKADGVTDNEPAINGAIRYAQTNIENRSVVLLPPGEMLVKDTICLKRNEGDRPIALHGAGREETYVLSKDRGPVLWIEGAGNALRNLSIEYIK